MHLLMFINVLSRKQGPQALIEKKKHLDKICFFINCAFFKLEILFYRHFNGSNIFTI